jgi:hypothetical protein
VTDLSRHVVYSGGYVVMPNDAVNDRRLSFRARGLLAYMLGRPPGWSFSAKRLALEGLEGREAIAAAIRELSAMGYYRVERVNAGRGRFVMVTEVAARPDLMPPPGTGYRGPVDRGPVDRGPVDRAPVKQAPMSLQTGTPDSHLTVVK